MRPHMSFATNDSTKNARDNARNIRKGHITVTTRTPTNDELKAIADDGAPKTEPEKKARKTKGADGEALAELLGRTGLVLTRKSADHWHGPGGEKGPRLVVPRGKSVTRVYGYKLSGGPGFKTEEQRKTEGLGAVTNVLEVSSAEDVKPLIEAVVQAVAPTVAPDAPSSSEEVEKAPAKETKGRKNKARQTELVASAEKPDAKGK